MKRLLPILVMFAMVTCLMITVTAYTIPDNTLVQTQYKNANFTKTGFTVTGDGATDMVAIAELQVGKTTANLGYTEDWCADFVSDCAILAKQTSAIPGAGACSTLYNNIINAGGKVVSTPQKGDIAFFYNTGASTPAHVALMADSSYSINGNYYSSKVGAYIVRKETYSNVCSWDGRTVKFVRPAYGAAPTTTTTTATTTTTYSDPILGDVNHDHVLDLIDILTLRQHLIDIPVTFFETEADLNEDTFVDLKDVFLLRKLVMEIEQPEETSTTITTTTTTTEMEA